LSIAVIGDNQGRKTLSLGGIVETTSVGKHSRRVSRLGHSSQKGGYAMSGMRRGIFVVSLLFGVLFLFVSQSSACCNIYNPACHNWTGLVYGNIDLGTQPTASGQGNGKAKVSVDKVSAVLDVSQAVLDDFRLENITSDLGFIILEAGTRKVIGFVPASRTHNPSAEQKVNPQQAVKSENQEFINFAKGGSSNQ